MDETPDLLAGETRSESTRRQQHALVVAATALTIGQLFGVGQFVIDQKELRNSRLRILPLELRCRAWTNLTKRAFTQP